MFDRSRGTQYKRKLAEAHAADVRRAVKREQQAEALAQPDKGRTRSLLKLFLLLLVAVIVLAFVKSTDASIGAF